MSEGRIRLVLERAPKPLSGQHVLAEVNSYDSCDRFINGLPMRVAVTSVDQVSVILPTGDCHVIGPGKTWGDFGLRPGVDYKVEVRGQALDLDFSGDTATPTDFISMEQYDKMEGTLRDHLRKNKLGKFSDEYQAKKQEEEQQQLEIYEQIKDKVGSRVELVDNGNRGELMFIGETEFSAGLWAGIKLDEPFGKNNGTVQGKSYFTCYDKYGLFLRLNKFTVGDFPPSADELDDEII